MEILVLGAGVIGTTSAYYLAQAGHKVTVIDRQENVALETSFANAGQISPGYASPWAAPGIPLKAFKWLFQKHAPLSIHMTSDFYQYEWMLKMLLECNEKSYQKNKARMMRLSEYSRNCLDDLRKNTNVQFEGRQLGTLQLFRTQKQLETATQDIHVLQQQGVPHELLDRNGVIKIEQGLARATADFVGGLRLPHDQTGDCYKFTNQIAELAKQHGVTFKFGQTIKNITQYNQKIIGIELVSGETIKADAYVLALGSYSHQFLKKIGIYAPVYPFKGYSITADIMQEAHAPVSTILDETYKIALTRFDSRIRIGGMAEIDGFNLQLNAQRKETLHMVLEQLFPDVTDSKNLNFWTGLRPATPDGTPIVGRTIFDNLFLNTGHGTLGWTMACGSAKVLADIISKRTPDIDTEDLNLTRYLGNG